MNEHDVTEPAELGARTSPSPCGTATRGLVDAYRIESADHRIVLPYWSDLTPAQQTAWISHMQRPTSLLAYIAAHVTKDH